MALYSMTAPAMWDDSADVNKKDTLEKAIHKAINSGLPELLGHRVNEGSHIEILELNSQNDGALLDDGHMTSFHVNEIIFNHDFAKALWGEETNDVTNGDDQLYEAPWWQYHLAHMVIAEDPIKYLGDNI